MKKLKIVLVDDHKIVRQGFSELLKKNERFEIIGEANNGREILGMLNNNVKPDIIIMDIEMPELNGIDTLAIIKKQYSEIKVIILSMFDGSNYIKKALSHGASGYLLKDIETEELYQAIEKVAEGSIYLSERMNQQIIESFVGMTQDEKYKSPLDTLSNREREVFQLIAEGYSGKEIADRLNISYKTVEHHKYRIMDKLKCFNTTHLVRLAIKEGIISS